MNSPSFASDAAASPAERLAVMISSTSLDLPKHREAVRDAVERFAYFPLAMEHGSAEAGSNALSFSLRMADQADLFIGIIAFRYGYVPDDPVANPNGWSVTEHEYRRAIQRGIPVLLYLMHDEHPVTRKDFELSEQAQGKLEALKAELKTKHICGFFRSVEELKSLVLQSLSDVKLSLLQKAVRAVSAGPFQSPPLPGHYVRRPHEEKRLEDDLMRQDGGPGVVVSAVFGLGGIGKSTLAAAVVQSPRVRERFPDGVLWLTLGQNPDLQSLAGQWIRDLGDHEFRAADLRAASGRLRQLLQERAVLLVVDDAWQSEHVEPFRVGGPHCRLLVTTRKPRIADDIHAIRHELDVLSPEQAVELLASRLQRPLRDDECGPARRLAKAVGHLPLALELAAVRIGRNVSWERLLGQLEQEVAALEALDDATERWKRKGEEPGRRQLEASLQLSLRALREEAEEAWRCFVWLGVLPDDTTLAAPMASALWDFAEQDEADGLLEFLWGEALLQPAAAVRVGGKQWRAYRVHDLLHDCARRLLEAPPGREGSLPGLGLTRTKAHGQLLQRYRKRTRDGQWHTLAADGYIHGRLGWHLEQAGDVQGLHALLREETAEGRNGWYEANERLGQPSIFADCVAQAWGLALLGLQCHYALVTASLNSLAKNLPPALLAALVRQGQWSVKQALAYAQRTPEAGQKAKALAALVPLLEPAEHPELRTEALQAALAVRNEAYRWQALAALASHLPPELVPEALQAALAIDNAEYRCRALAALTPHLLPEERLRVMTDALQAALAIQYEGDRCEALAALAPHLPPALLPEALRDARAMRYEGVRSDALAALAPHLPPEMLTEALQAARAIGDAEARSQALVVLTPHFSPEERLRVLTEALQAALAIRNEGDLCLALAALAPHLPPELVSETFQAARAIGDAGYRCRALAALAPHLPLKEQLRVLTEALQAARAIGDAEARSQALVVLTPHFSPEERLRVLTEALRAALAVRNEAYRWQALAALASHLPPELVPEALQAALAIDNAGYRCRALAALTPHLLPEERLRVMTDALQAARAIGNEGDRCLALGALTPHLPPELLPEALQTARAIQCAEFRCPALAALAPHLPLKEQLRVLSKSLPEALAIVDAGYRGQALAALVPQLSLEERLRVLPEALQAALAIRGEGDRRQALMALAPHLPAVMGLLSRALQPIREEQDRCRALAALAPHLPPNLLPEAVQAARSLRDERARFRVLAALVSRLAASQYPDLPTLWGELCHLLASRTRPELLGTLPDLTPVLAALAGPNAPIELREIARAISDVARWWP